MDEKKESIKLITHHQAKGMEFPVVFMVGHEEGMIPHCRSLDDLGQIEEERRAQVPAPTAGVGRSGANGIG